MATVIEQDQYNVLWQTTATNPLLPYSAIASQNKSLATNAKQVIKAINEVLTNNKLTQSTLDSFMTNFNTFVALIGDTYADLTLTPKLDAIGDNVILALDSLSVAIKGLGESLADKTDTSTTKEISNTITQINKSISAIDTTLKNGVIGSGGGTVAQEIINLGSCNLPRSSTSVYQSMAYIIIPSAVIPKINFNKPLRLQIYQGYTGGYAKSFDALMYDNGINLGNDILSIGYTQDKTSIAIMNNKYTISASKVCLIIE